MTPEQPPGYLFHLAQALLAQQGQNVTPIQPAGRPGGMMGLNPSPEGVTAISPAHRPGGAPPAAGGMQQQLDPLTQALINQLSVRQPGAGF